MTKKTNFWGVIEDRHRIVQKGLEILVHPVESRG